MNDYETVQINSLELDRAIPHTTQNPKVKDQLEESLIRAIRSGVSISSAAKSAGVATATAQRMATRHGIPIERRSKKITGDLRTKLAAAAKNGQSKQTIAEKLGVAPQTVMRFINTEPGLATAWRRACIRRATREKRRLWKDAAAKFGQLGTQAVREQEPAAYAWLYRNDREWLALYNQQTILSARNNNVAIDWGQRDERLAAMIHRSIATTFSRLPDEKRTLGRLCELIPELKAKLAKLDRLPTSAKLVRSNVLNESVDKDISENRNG